MHCGKCDVENGWVRVLTGTEAGLWANRGVRACVVSQSEVKLSTHVRMARQEIPRRSARIGRNPAYITTGMYLSLVGILHTLLLARTSHWSESCIHYYWHVPLIGRNPAYITTGMYLSLVGILHTLLLACTSQYLSVLVLVYKVDLHWARLVVRWVTVDPVVNQVEGLFLSTPNDRFFTSRKYE